MQQRAAADHAYDDLPDEQRVAKLIAKYVGGMENVRNAEHCATRLRLIVNDKSKIDEKAIENIDGVKGQFFAAAQYQIILGTGFVDKVFDEFIKGTTFSGVSNKEEAYAQMTPIQKVSRTLSASTTSSTHSKSSSSPRRASIRSTPSSRARSSRRAARQQPSRRARRTRKSARSMFRPSFLRSSASRSRSSSVSTCAS